MRLQTDLAGRGGTPGPRSEHGLYDCEPGVNSPRVLIVEDNAVNVELAAYILQADGFEVQVAGDAVQALECLGTSLPDVVLMDIQLPGMDGLDLTRRLRADPATQGLVIVAFTAYSMRGDEARMRAAGCDGYISKPIDLQTFVSSVRSCMKDPLHRPHREGVS